MKTCRHALRGQVFENLPFCVMRPNKSKRSMDIIMKIMDALKKESKRVKKYIVTAAAGSAMATVLCSQTVFAAGVDSVTQPLANLKTLVISIIGAVGVIILAKNVMEFAQAYQQQDSSSMNSAIKGIVAGLIMAGISSVLAFLGIS